MVFVYIRNIFQDVFQILDRVGRTLDHTRFQGELYIVAGTLEDIVDLIRQAIEVVLLIFLNYGLRLYGKEDLAVVTEDRSVRPLFLSSGGRRFPTRCSAEPCEYPFVLL